MINDCTNCSNHITHGGRCYGADEACVCHEAIEDSPGCSVDEHGDWNYGFTKRWNWPRTAEQAETFLATNGHE